MLRVSTSVPFIHYAIRSELGILEEKLVIERLKEQSWRDEYKEISGVCFF